MGKSLLSVNAGSSSVKVTFYTMTKPPKVIANAQVSGITAPPQNFKYQCGGDKKKQDIEEKLSTPQDAFKYLLDQCFKNPQLSEVASSEDLAYILHRIVHGGNFADAIEINDETFDQLKKIEDLAPLHNFAALEIVRLCMKELPNVKSITYFDSSFHKTLPEHVKTYPINQDVARSNGLRKYGFHGISYSFIVRSVAEFLDKPAEKTNITTMHIGSGASVCAIKDGKSVDTSMGLTPLAGLPGATRCGDVDPSLVLHYTDKEGDLKPASANEMNISNAEEILNKKSGWKILAGTTDFSKIAVEKPPSKEHKLAFDIVVDRISGFIGNYFVKLEGQVDALVFAGGIGEKSSLLRKCVVEQCKCLGFAIDEAANSKGPESDEQTVTDISKDRTKTPRVLICQTDEQFEMAFHCINWKLK